ncbi:MAG: hypothetical protein WAV89_04010 [Ignavibacteriaceae bacterium]
MIQNKINAPDRSIPFNLVSLSEALSLSVIYLLPTRIMNTAISYSSIRLLRAKGEEGCKYICNLYLGVTFGLIVFLVMSLIGL